MHLFWCYRYYIKTLKVVKVISGVAVKENRLQGFSEYHTKRVFYLFLTIHNILSVHSVKGGEKTIHLKNGKSVRLHLSPISTTLLNPETGEVILR